MPRVPSVEQTATGAQPFTAPGVAPVRNYAPEQLQQAGAVESSAGAFEMHAGQTIGNRIAEQVDDAKTKQAETAFLSSAQSILNDPQKGYLYKRGQDAVNGFQPAQKALVKAGNDAMASLTNPIQKQMFTQVRQQHLLAFGKQMADFNHAQSVSWSAQESKARAERYQILAQNASDSRYQTDAQGAPVGDFAKFTQQMEAEVNNAAQLAGFAPDSAQAAAMRREQWTALNTAMISKMLDAHDGAGAKQWFDEQNAAGHLDLRSISTLGNAVKAEYSRQQTLSYVDQVVIPTVLNGDKTPVTLAMPVAGSSINVTSQMGEARANGRKHDGIDIAVPVGTSVTAPAGGKVLKVWNDEQFGGGLSVQVQMPNGYIAGFAHLSAANVRVGDEVQQGTQLGLSGKSGNATGPVLHYAMRNEKGQYVDPRTVSQAQPNPAGISDPTALAKGLQMIAGSDLSPEQKRSAASYLQQQHAQQRSITDQQQSDLFKQAGDAFYAGGLRVSAVPPSLFSRLTPEQQHKLQDEQTSEVLKNYNQGQAFKEMGDVDLKSYFYQNPDMLTPANVDAARPKLANGDYLSLMREASNLQQNPKGVVEAQNVQERIKYFASAAGINVSPKSTADKETYNALQYRISNAIDQVKSQHGGKATSQQVDQAIKEQLIQHSFAGPKTGFFGGLSSSKARYTFQLPEGATHVAKGSDDKLHYTNAAGADLGVAN